MLSADASFVTSASLLVDAGFIVNAELCIWLAEISPFPAIAKVSRAVARGLSNQADPDAGDNDSPNGSGRSTCG
jgi:hypothetical protein